MTALHQQQPHHWQSLEQLMLNGTALRKDEMFEIEEEDAAFLSRSAQLLAEGPTFRTVTLVRRQLVNCKSSEEAALATLPFGLTLNSSPADQSNVSPTIQRRQEHTTVKQPPVLPADLIFVHSLEPGSGAALSGLRSGDQVVAVNGLSVLTSTFQHVLQLIRRSSAVLVLTVSPVEARYISGGVNYSTVFGTSSSSTMSSSTTTSPPLAINGAKNGEIINQSMSQERKPVHFCAALSAFPNYSTVPYNCHQQHPIPLTAPSGAAVSTSKPLLKVPVVVDDQNQFGTRSKKLTALVPPIMFSQQQQQPVDQVKKAVTSPHAAADYSGSSSCSDIACQMTTSSSNQQKAPAVNLANHLLALQPSGMHVQFQSHLTPFSFSSQQQQQEDYYHYKKHLHNQLVIKSEPSSCHGGSGDDLAITNSNGNNNNSAHFFADTLDHRPRSSTQPEMLADRRPPSGVSSPNSHGLRQQVTLPGRRVSFLRATRQRAGTADGTIAAVKTVNDQLQPNAMTKESNPTNVTTNSGKIIVKTMLQRAKQRLWTIRTVSSTSSTSSRRSSLAIPPVSLVIENFESDPLLLNGVTNPINPIVMLMSQNSYQLGRNSPDVALSSSVGETTSSFLLNQRSVSPCSSSFLSSPSPPAGMSPTNPDYSVDAFGQSTSSVKKLRQILGAGTPDILQARSISQRYSQLLPSATKSGHVKLKMTPQPRLFRGNSAELHSLSPSNAVGPSVPTGFWAPAFLILSRRTLHVFVVTGQPSSPSSPSAGAAVPSEIVLSLLAFAADVMPLAVTDPESHRHSLVGTSEQRAVIQLRPCQAITVDMHGRSQLDFDSMAWEYWLMADSDMETINWADKFLQIRNSAANSSGNRALLDAPSSPSEFAPLAAVDDTALDVPNSTRQQKRSHFHNHRQQHGRTNSKDDIDLTSSGIPVGTPPNTSSTKLPDWKAWKMRLAFSFKQFRQASATSSTLRQRQSSARLGGESAGGGSNEGSSGSDDASSPATANTAATTGSSSRATTKAPLSSYTLPGTKSGLYLASCEPSTSNPYVPAVVELCTAIVEARGLDTVGVYRVPGNNSNVTSLWDSIIGGGVEAINSEDPRWSDVNVVGSLLKSFLRRLSEPLFPYSVYRKLISANRQPNSEKRMLTIKRHIHELPPHHYETLRFLAKHLQLVASNSSRNKMDSQNLAIVFGPTLIRGRTTSASSSTPADAASETKESKGDKDKTMPQSAGSIDEFVKDTSDQCRIVQTIITHVDWFFAGWEADSSVPEDTCDNAAANVFSQLNAAIGLPSSNSQAASSAPQLPMTSSTTSATVTSSASGSQSTPSPKDILSAVSAKFRRRRSDLFGGGPRGRQSLPAPPPPQRVRVTAPTPSTPIQSSVTTMGSMTVISSRPGPPSRADSRTLLPGSVAEDEEELAPDSGMISAQNSTSATIQRSIDVISNVPVTGGVTTVSITGGSLQWQLRPSFVADGAVLDAAETARLSTLPQRNSSSTSSDASVGVPSGKHRPSLPVMAENSEPPEAPTAPRLQRHAASEEDGRAAVKLVEQRNGGIVFSTGSPKSFAINRPSGIRNPRLALAVECRPSAFGRSISLDSLEVFGTEPTENIGENGPMATTGLTPLAVTRSDAEAALNSPQLARLHAELERLAIAERTSYAEAMCIARERCRLQAEYERLTATGDGAAVPNAASSSSTNASSSN